MEGAWLCVPLRDPRVSERQELPRHLQTDGRPLGRAGLKGWPDNGPETYVYILVPGTGKYVVALPGNRVFAGARNLRLLRWGDELIKKMSLT